MSSKIALLATGDEIVNGDILNTNGQAMAQQLVDQGLQVGLHLSTPDVVDDIVDAIGYLLQQHHAIIITGGLGPTSDDRTRFALAQAVGQSLIFDEETWQAIVARITSFNLSVPESNKQQALFPENAKIIPNPHGTAAGCYVEYEGKFIFMLPGPPRECLPMFHEVVLPVLLNSLDKNTLVQRKWRLFGVSEGHIATVLEEALAPFNITTGYRLDYPYIEFKVFAEDRGDLEILWQQVEKIVNPHLLSHDYFPASQLLIAALESYEGLVAIEDAVTGGRLASKIFHTNTQHALYFGDLSRAMDATLTLKVSGLKGFWQHPEKNKNLSLTMTFSRQGKTEVIEETLPFRHEKVIYHAIEVICHHLLQRL